MSSMDKNIVSLSALNLDSLSVGKTAALLFGDG